MKRTSFLKSHLNSFYFITSKYFSSSTIVSSKSINIWPNLYKHLLTRIKENGVESLEDKFVPVAPSKGSKSEDNISYFLDFKKVEVIGGNGGDGGLSFMRFKNEPHAGPGGGDGGNGGHVIFQATKHVRSLNHLPSIIKAKPGERGGSKECFGKDAPHYFAKVPLNTLFKQDDKLICRLDEEEALFVAARGGAGGKGNIFFKTNEDQAPSVAEYGGIGEKFEYDVELQIMADVGFIGYPNAGKSTLLRAISRARPKVAAYPFTTLNPYVGIVEFEDFHQMAVADLPGLIKDAHKNKGLGFSFLRHIERCSCLLYVIDASLESPSLQLSVLKNELELYSKGLSERPHAIVANKMDLPNSKENFLELQKHTDLPVIPISGKHELNLIPLLALMRLLTDPDLPKEKESSMI